MTGEHPGPAAPPGGEGRPRRGQEGGRRRRRTAPRESSGLKGQAYYALVAGGVFLGLLTAWQNFRVGTYVMAASMLLGAALRVGLPESRLGFLVTRKKWTDVGTMAVLGTGLAVLAFLAPRGG
ncbi:DUF3017 domain-containing protein [Actinocorallia sp. A-T 12471]|uniref:DUF3017 domain-containing protein n=1 Tax=Actinocorallia sp. A-T 12471 TaxID=3089813 RepID=UPI0029CBA115|nr:DUF3017 domain-containing protein [Actinocorallia sp. A-T 12471]MDX6744476.1 DUF3017 domain-containing protein [Actinocorallia sp. A-T 12471]